MFRKILVCLFCAVFLCAIVLTCFMVIYFILPSQKARASITLPATVEDTEQTSEEGTTESTEDDDVYVADVYQSLTLRTEPNSDSHAGDVSLVPLTHLRKLEDVEGTDYAYVEVLSGEYKSYKGYVNNDYITLLGENTIRVNWEEE